MGLMKIVAVVEGLTGIVAVLMGTGVNIVACAVDVKSAEEGLDKCLLLSRMSAERSRLVITNTSPTARASGDPTNHVSTRPMPNNAKILRRRKRCLVRGVAE